MQSLPDVVADRYRLGPVLGRGGQAVVHVAEDLRLERLVAIKLLHPSLAGDEAFLRRFRKEATLAARLAHRNVVAVLDWGPDGTADSPGGVQPFLVTELLRAGSLADLLATGFRATPGQALLIGLQAARGLVAAEAAGLVHRDIKPANLLFDVDGRLCVADFGIARALDATATVGGDTVGSLLGTARYASPEQVEGLPVDGRTDVYSLALCIVEAITGETPFAPKDGSAVSGLVARVGRDLLPPPAVGPLYDALLAAGRADAGQRADAKAFGRALKAAATDLDRPARLPLAAREELFGEVVRPKGAAVSGGEAPRSQPTPEPEEELVEAPEALEPLEDEPLDADATMPMPLPVPTPAAQAPPPSRTPPVSWPSNPTPAAAPVRISTTPVLDEPLEEDDEPDDVDGVAVEPKPKGRTLRRVLVGLVLLAVLGAGGSFLAIKKPWLPYHSVPPLRGQSRSEAIAALDALDLKARVVSKENDEDVPAGSILRAIERRGQEGTTIQLVESLGPVDRKLPPLIGLTEKAARDALTELRVQVSTTTRPDEVAAAGTVLEADPAAGATVPRDSTVNLVLSSGPAPRTIPSLALKTPDEAKVALGALGLVPAQNDAFSDTVPAGQVIGTDPAAGKQVARGSTVTITVSKGPDLVVVPDVINKSTADAQTILKAAGLNVAATIGPPVGTVTAVDPGVGSKAKRGSGVTLTSR